MASVVIVVPEIAAKRFSGGLLCLFEYANALVARGHGVAIVPIGPSAYPEWFEPRFSILLLRPPRTPAMGRRTARGSFKRRLKQARRLIEWAALMRVAQLGPYAFRRARQIEWLRGRLPEADVTLATSFETALPVHLHGTGRKFYFSQHFEPLFADDYEDPALAEIEALLSYRLPLSLIANSTWLAKKLEKEVDRSAPVCTNAIDHRVFFREGPVLGKSDRPLVLSYGGRNARWKGIEDAAEAVRIARAKIPGLEWRVFGDTLLAPDNPVATYVPLGFLTGAKLRRAYCAVHAVLCSSWYESFPLYPLEAMACGAAVVTTPLGVEDYAFDGKNALVVPAREPRAMADALVRVLTDAALRAELGERAQADARRHTWEKSSARMSELLGIEARS
jgi:glycosyltransferase involved in cell wall biosynthesis